MKSCVYERYSLGVAKKRKPAEWERKPCGCTKAKLSIGKVVVRCERHRGKPSKKRKLCYWEEGQVRLEA